MRAGASFVAGLRPWAVAALVFSSLAARDARAQSVQLTPFAGYQFGGSFYSPTLNRNFDVDSGLAYGGTLDVALNDHWRVEGMYSRQATEIGNVAGAPFDLHVEHYMAGIMEEKGEGKSRFFGTALLGATRFVPGLPGFDSKINFTVAVSLGLKYLPSKHLGVRVETRGFYTITEADGGLFCVNGACLFAFTGSGLWQGDVSAGLILAF